MPACGNCGAANAGGARFCASCGVALALTCPSCGSPLPEGARFCPSCGTALGEQLPGVEERKLVTVLFADVTGSTGLGERLDPEHLKEVMGTYFAAMREEIEAEGGTVEKFIGDAVMAAFGVPEIHEDDPARALRAALRMRGRLGLVNETLSASHGVALEIRIGVNTGEVLASLSPREGEGIVSGDAVNVAARLQTAAKPGQVIVSDRTARAVRGFRFEELGDLELRGKQVRTRALQLVGEPPLAPERGVPGLRAPMVGRDQELALLQTMYGRVATEDRPSLVTIYGDPGVGKSRLTAEFLSWAESREPPPIVVRGRCLPYGDGVTYWPLAEILKGQAGVLDSDPPELALERILKAGRELFTQDVAIDPARSTAALAYTVGVEDPDIRFADLEPRQVRAEVHAAWRSFFSALAKTAPVVTVVEDIHWADPVLLDLLEELAERVQGAVLLVCPSRPELTATRPGWGGGRRNVSSIALDPLSEVDAERLVEALLAIDDLAPSVHARILGRAEGNPFFLEEIIRHMIDEGHIVREHDRWRAAGGINEAPIPDTVQAVLASRIDLLDPPVKRVLQAAAVVGRVFWPGPVRLLLDGEAGLVGDSVEILEGRELVLSRLGSSIAGEPEFIFKHILTRDVAYETLPRRDRGAAHARVAAWIEQTAGERSREFVELLAYHYSTAVRERLDAPPDDLRAKAFDSLLRASADARSKLVLKKAQRMAEEAVPLAANQAERSRALEALAEAFLTDYQGDLAWRYFCEAADACLAVEPADRLRIAYLCARAVDLPIRWPGSMRTVPSEEDVARYLQTGFSHLPPGDSEERVRLQVAHSLWPFGFPDYEMPDEELFEFEREGLEAADAALRLGRPNLASAALDAAASAAVSRGLYARVREIEARRLPLVPRLTDLLEIGDAYAAVAWEAHELGFYEEAVRIATEGLEAVGARGRQAAAEIHALSWRAAARYAVGDWDGVMDDFGELQDRLDERREDPPYFASHAFAAAGLVHQARGETVEVDAILAYLVPLASGSSRLVPWLGRLLVERNALGEAHRLLDRPPERWRVHAGAFFLARMELAAAEGTWEAARTLLTEVRAHAAEAELVALPLFADRLEGRAALALGDAPRATELLSSAADGFGQLGAAWEQARTRLVQAEASIGAGSPAEARTALEEALTVFDRLRAVREIDHARELRRRCDA